MACGVSANHASRRPISSGPDRDPPADPLFRRPSPRTLRAIASNSPKPLGGLVFGVGAAAAVKKIIVEKCKNGQAAMRKTGM